MQSATVGFAGVCAIFFFELAKSTLNLDSPQSNAGNWIVVLLSTLSVYTLSFTFGNWAHRSYLWRVGAATNLNGCWELRLTNLSDNSIRTGDVYIRQDRDHVNVKGINYKPGIDGTFSTWSSRLTIMTDSTLFILYEVETSQDPGKNFKRGVIRLQLPEKRNLPLVGDFYDNAPSDDRGPIALSRQTKP